MGTSWTDSARSPSSASRLGGPPATGAGSSYGVRCSTVSASSASTGRSARSSAAMSSSGGGGMLMAPILAVRWPAVHVRPRRSSGTAVRRRRSPPSTGGGGEAAFPAQRGREAVAPATDPFEHLVGSEAQLLSRLGGLDLI